MNFGDLPQKTVARMEKTMKPAKEIRFGCRFGGEEIVVIQISAGVEGNVELARELRYVIEKDNMRRAYMNRPKIPYKIATSEKLSEQFPDVADGSFKLEDSKEIEQMVDLGKVFFASKPVFGEE